MRLLDAREIAEIHASLRRVGASNHKHATAAKQRIARLDGEPMTDDDATAIRSWETQAFPVARVDPSDPDPEIAARLATRAVPIGDLLGLTDPHEPRFRRRRSMPIP